MCVAETGAAGKAEAVRNKFKRLMIFPSGFLPVSGGNVLNESLTDVYRNSGLFKTLRDTTQREGKCGICEYQKICGGSRARAYALTGDFLAEDPRCTYQPHLADAIAG